MQNNNPIVNITINPTIAGTASKEDNMNNINWKNITSAQLVQNACVQQMLLNLGVDEAHGQQMLTWATAGRIKQIASIGEFDSSLGVQVATPFGDMGIQHGASEKAGEYVSFKLFPPKESIAGGIIGVDNNGNQKGDITYTLSGFLTRLNIFGGNFEDDKGFEALHTFAEENCLGQRKVNGYDFSVNTYRHHNYVMVFQARQGKLDMEKDGTKIENFTITAAVIFRIETGAVDIVEVGLNRGTRVSGPVTRQERTKITSGKMLMESIKATVVGTQTTEDGASVADVLGVN